ncbi:juvenile hormone acid O-methyltransferase-like [Anticarsia gemmatalis]|uniref:juvenile hormone acid O-methyltransferase-like n=1 Tax=Anticarsia gemmatalis TaxID=129554 RepID=UPI003F76A4C6
MHNADLYHQNNDVQKRDAVLCLDKIAPKMKWKKSNNKIIDIGCGDGSVTNILKRYLPDNYKLLGCDISESMVNFANNNHCDEQSSFIVLDITRELPPELKNNFDHVFSFNALHWISDQEAAFKNIYDVMEQDARCVIMFLGWNPIFDVYRALARNDKWAVFMKDAEKYIPRYHDLKNPAGGIMKMMENIGYVNIDVDYEETYFIFDAFRDAMKSINPFNIPEDQYNEFFEDYLNVLRELTSSENVAKNPGENVKLNYNIITIYANKPSITGD